MFGSPRNPICNGFVVLAQKSWLFRKIGDSKFQKYLSKLLYFNLKKEIKAETYTCDSSNIESVSKLFKETDKSIGTPGLVIYNASSRPKRDSIIELDPKETQKAINITCFGAFLVAQEATKRMLKRKKGSIFFTGATAGVKGFANSSVFAMGKFGLRGLAQSLARELHPQGIHCLLYTSPSPRDRG